MATEKHVDRIEQQPQQQQKRNEMQKERNAFTQIPKDLFGVVLLRGLLPAANCLRKRICAVSASIMLYLHLVPHQNTSKLMVLGSLLPAANRVRERRKTKSLRNLSERL